MKIKIKTLFTGAAGFLLLVSQIALQAAPLNIPTPYPDPDITTNGAQVIYNYVGGGSGGTLTITGEGGGLVSSNMSLPGGGVAAISGNNTGGPIADHAYLLTANFNDAGEFVDGTVNVSGYVVDPGGFGSTIPNDFYGVNWSDSGTVLSMNLTDFGFEGTQTLAGDRDLVVLEWLGDIVGGDLFDIGFSGPNAIGGVHSIGNILWAGGSFGAGGWDEFGDTSAFTSSFASCGVSGCPLLLDTFVPVPAAIWLFGSGLLGLIGVGAHRRKSL